jgi:hypothetical protein
MFDKLESSIVVNSLFNRVRKFSKWITFDLLAYCWNFGTPRCQNSLAVLLGSALEYGGSFREVVEQFGANVAYKMFDAASDLTSTHNQRKNFKHKFPLIAYRGGYGDDSAQVACGMTWSLDIKTAANEARLPISANKQFYLLETLVLEDEVITQLNGTHEILIKFDPERQYETIEHNPEILPTADEQGVYV